MTSPIERVLALCDEWDALSKGETPTTRRIREAAKSQPSDVIPALFPMLSEEEKERIREQLKNPARIFILPNDGSTEFEIIDTEQLTLWGDEPCV